MNRSPVTEALLDQFRVEDIVVAQGGSRFWLSTGQIAAAAEREPNNVLVTLQKLEQIGQVRSRLVKVKGKEGKKTIRQWQLAMTWNEVAEGYYKYLARHRRPYAKKKAE